MKTNNKNKTATRKAVKQLDNLSNRLDAMLSKRKPVRRLNKRRPQRQNNRAVGITAVNVPMEIAYTVSQKTTQSVHREKACEYIGNVTFSPSSVIGTAMLFRMNPILLSGTRLARLASSFQKFRFRRLALTLQSSTTTSTNGLYIVGYNSNPDAEAPSGQAIPFAFDLPGAQSGNVWRTITSNGRIEDPRKWYNVDPESLEVMQTTQGYFMVVLQSVPSTTGPITFPVILDYEVEFTGSALNPLSTSPIQLFPAGTFTYNSVSGNYTFAAATGEPALPTTVNNVGYRLLPSYPITVVDSDGPTLITALIIMPTALSWAFFASEEDYDKAIPIMATVTQITPRTTIQSVTPN
jgi:hypothetical protein